LSNALSLALFLWFGGTKTYLLHIFYKKCVPDSNKNISVVPEASS